MKSQKYSFRTTNPDIINLLEQKKSSSEMSAYINEALIFYSKYGNSGVLLEVLLGKAKGLPVEDTLAQPQKPTEAEEVLLNSISGFL